MLDGFAGLMARVPRRRLATRRTFSDAARACRQRPNADLLRAATLARTAVIEPRKPQVTSRAADGVIIAASMYENTDIVLKLGQKPSDFAAPVLRRELSDGTLDASVDEKLRSFLYYV